MLIFKHSMCKIEIAGFGSSARKLFGSDLLRRGSGAGGEFELGMGLKTPQQQPERVFIEETYQIHPSRSPVAAIPPLTRGAITVPKSSVTQAWEMLSGV